jgi:predicted  nucleic acid-binding Zn-ribbon protein
MLIEVLYREGDVAIPYVLEVDFTQQDFNDLLKEISLDEIQSVTRKELEVQSKAFENIILTEIDRRWVVEIEKVKNEYDKIQIEYDKIGNAWKDIEKESDKINNSWKHLKKESDKINDAWKGIEKESDRIDSAWKELEKESDKINDAWKKLEKESGEIESTWKKIEKESVKIESTWKKIEKESKEIEQNWEEIQKESGKIENTWKEIDVYAETEKSKKMEEVQSEFQKLRKDLASRFNSSDAPKKIEAKDIFSELSSKEGDNDFVFNMKVSILEDPDIAKSKDKNLKLAIRKAKTIPELLSVYYSQKAS